MFTPKRSSQSTALKFKSPIYKSKLGWKISLWVKGFSAGSEYLPRNKGLPLGQYDWILLFRKLYRKLKNSRDNWGALENLMYMKIVYLFFKKNMCIFHLFYMWYSESRIVRSSQDVYSVVRFHSNKGWCFEGRFSENVLSFPSKSFPEMYQINKNNNNKWTIKKYVTWPGIEPVPSAWQTIVLSSEPPRCSIQHYKSLFYG